MARNFAGKVIGAVTVTDGYDIGIARAWLNHVFRFSPAQWQARIAGKQ